MVGERDSMLALHVWVREIEWTAERERNSPQHPSICSTEILQQSDICNGREVGHVEDDLSTGRTVLLVLLRVLLMALLLMLRVLLVVLAVMLRWLMVMGRTLMRRTLMVLLVLLVMRRTLMRRRLIIRIVVIRTTRRTRHATARASAQEDSVTAGTDLFMGLRCGDMGMPCGEIG